MGNAKYWIALFSILHRLKAARFGNDRRRGLLRHPEVIAAVTQNPGSSSTSMRTHGCFSGFSIAPKAQDKRFRIQVGLENK